MKPANAVGRSNQRMEAPAAARALPDADRIPQRSRADEAGLIERARQRDQEAFRILVDQHRDHAYGLALRITRSREDAEDASQEAFVRAWLALPAFRGEASFGTWLHRIVARQAFDRAAARRTRAARETDVDAAEELSVPPTSEARDLVLARRIERLMEGLSVGQRAVVALFYQEGRSVLEIASTLAMPEGTVKTHLHRARAALREAWAREEGGTP